MRISDWSSDVCSSDLLLVADGLSHRRLKQRAPYDLVIAHILAGPLIDMAPAIAEALKPGGTLILAGLLDHQADAVLATYMRQGCRPAGRLDREDWSTLRLMNPRAPYGETWGR